jgi:ABC-type multidrug transport system permease subunit
VSPLGLLVRIRLRDALGRAGSALTYFGLPLVLMLLAGGLFRHGHPFERRRLALVGAAVDPQLGRVLGDRADLRVSTAESLLAARGALRTRALDGVLELSVPPRLHVGPRDELWGRGLLSVLPAPVTLEIEPVPERAYLHYLFPGLVTWTVLVSGLLGMGYGMARWRRRQVLKKLALLPLSRASFVGAQILARALLTLGQVALMVALAVLGFGLPVSLAALAWTAALTLVGLIVFMGGGFALACAIRAEAPLMDAANAITVALLLVSEVFFPLDDLPAALRGVAKVLPSTQLVRLLRSVLAQGGASSAELWPGMLLLLAWAVGLYAVAVLHFRWTAD